MEDYELFKWIFFNFIPVLKKGRLHSQLFSLVIHELAHVAQAEYNGTTDWGLVMGRKQIESWGEVVEWYITKSVFPSSATLSSNNNKIHRQNQTINDIQNGTNEDKFYTPIGIDLIDDYNQSQKGSAFANDVVTGYTMTQLENSIPYYPNWNAWKNNIINDYNHPNEYWVEYLFEKYE